MAANVRAKSALKGSLKMNNKDFVKEISKVGNGATFLSVNEYTNSHGEIADYSIIFNVSYESVLKRSITQLETYLPEDSIELQAKLELIKSYEASLKKLSSSSEEEIQAHYTHFKGKDGYIKGVKLHTDSNTLHLYGTVVHKRVIQDGSYKKVNSSALTLAKKKISADLPVAKWRQFKITPSQVKSISVRKNHIEL